jgi:F0F1-type ATP synthase delta subunit
MKRSRVTPRLIAQTLLSEAAEGKEDLGTLAEAALLLLEKHGLQREIPNFLSAVAAVLDDRMGRKRANLTVGFGDADETAVTLERMLKSTQGGLWHISAARDENLLGGVRLRVGDDQIDASLRAALHQLTTHLAV